MQARNLPDKILSDPTVKDAGETSLWGCEPHWLTVAKCQEHIK